MGMMDIDWVANIHWISFMQRKMAGYEPVRTLELARVVRGEAAGEMILNKTRVGFDAGDGY